LKNAVCPQIWWLGCPSHYGPYARTIVGNGLILLDPKTGLILDVMQEIFDLPVDATLEKAGVRRVNY